MLRCSSGKRAWHVTMQEEGAWHVMIQEEGAWHCQSWRPQSPSFSCGCVGVGRVRGWGWGGRWWRQQQNWSSSVGAGQPSSQPWSLAHRSVSGGSAHLASGADPSASADSSVPLPCRAEQLGGVGAPPPRLPPPPPHEDPGQCRWATVQCYHIASNFHGVLNLLSREIKFQPYVM